MRPSPKPPSLRPIVSSPRRRIGLRASLGLGLGSAAGLAALAFSLGGVTESSAGAAITGSGKAGSE